MATSATPYTRVSATLSGTLKIQFAGRILPHENTKVVLYGKGVSSLSGKFDRVDVPKGWLYDLTYDYKKPEVVIKNFRPDRPPAFPAQKALANMRSVAEAVE